MGSVLHIMNYSASYRGNFIESLENLGRSLKNENLRNIYLFCREAHESDALVWIYEMKSNGEVTEFLSGDQRADALLIRKMTADYDVRIVHTHFITFGQFLTVHKGVSREIPIVMHMHNHSKKCNFAKSLIRKLIYKKCRMLACSESVYRSLERDYPDNEKSWIDNGVYFNRLENYVTISAEEYNIPSNAKKLLIFGFDFYRKGVDLAVKAVEKLRRDGENYILLISLSTNFEYVREQIARILGDVPDWIRIIKARNDIASLYNYVDVFLSPSREEGLPYSVVEAGYCDCSVVLSDISAQARLKLQYAYWFENENTEMLAEKIQEAVIKHDEKLTNIESVKEYMRNNYDLDIWSHKVMDVYHSVLNKE